MKSLKEISKQAEKNKTAIGHFNVSDLVGLKAVFEAARELQIPIIIGVSEREREFIGVKQISALIKSLKEQYDFPIFLNADHTHSLEKIKEAAGAGFDAVMFDGSQLPLEENIKQTKQAVEVAKGINPNILVEGELGRIEGESSIWRGWTPNANKKQHLGSPTWGTSDVQKLIKEEELVKPEQVNQFIKETGIDLLAPAIGNIHGIINRGNPKLDIERIKQIKILNFIPLALHGGSGIKDEEILVAIDAGIIIVHINTELRLAWRRGMKRALEEKPDEIVPYKLLPIAVEEIKKTVEQKLKLFNKILK